jgi:hypothetical protein
MEAIIVRTSNRNRLRSLIQFLRTLDFQVETKEEQKEAASGKTKTNFNEAVKFWRSLKVDMSGFKFNREDAYER